MILLLGVPILAQEIPTEIPDIVGEPIVIGDSEPVIVVDNDSYGIIGMVVVAVIAVVLILVSGFTNGKYFESFERATRHVIDNKPLGDEIEKRVSQWSADKRRYANSILNVLDPYTDFSWTDLDDDIKVWARDKLDGIVEPAGDGVSIQIAE